MTPTVPARVADWQHHTSLLETGSTTIRTMRRYQAKGNGRDKTTSRLDLLTEPFGAGPRKCYLFDLKERQKTDQETYLLPWKEE
jgi:hypothetical protein